METKAAKVVVEILGEERGLKRATSSAKHELSGLGKMGHAAGKAVAGGMLVMTGAAIAFGVEAVKMGMDFEEEQKHLRNSIESTGEHWDKYKDRIDKAVESSANFGVGNSTEVMHALSFMTTGLGSARRALEHFSLVQDISSQTGKSLQESAVLVTKALEGQIKPLKALGIDAPIASSGAMKLNKAQDALRIAEDNLRKVEDAIHSGRIKGSAAAKAFQSATDKLKTAQDKVNAAAGAGKLIVDLLGKKYGGDAKKNADDFAQKQKELKDHLHNVQTEIGIKLLPMLDKLETWILKHGIPGVQNWAKTWSMGMKQMGDDLYKFGQSVQKDVAAIDHWVNGSADNVYSFLNGGSDGSKKLVDQTKLAADWHKRVAPGSYIPLGLKGQPAAPPKRGKSDFFDPQPTQAPAQPQRHPKRGPANANQDSSDWGNVTIINNWPAGSNPRDVATAQAKHKRRNGQR